MLSIPFKKLLISNLLSHEKGTEDTVKKIAKCT